MSTSRTEAIQPNDHPQWVQSRRTMPAWLMSMLMHGLVLTLLILTVQSVSKGIGDEPARQGSIALANRSENTTDYFDGDSSQSADGQSTNDAQQTQQSVADAMPAADLPPSPLGDLLPRGDSALSGQEATGLPSAGGMTQGGATSKGGLGNDGKTSVFGAEGEGSKFVYVFDRSASMTGGPLNAAKQELIKSLHDLDKLHQFAIIFYNENPQVFSPRGNGPELVFADEQGKALAERFVRGIIASGSTQHVDALAMALNMKPDVIFFLTDAEQPQLFPADLDRIRKLNKGTSIHAIEFGYGPFDGRRNFLVKLADENDGKHVYVDISGFRR
ncbi:hypothetical protein GC197_12670 [bacterium]|nr:hypothetical protein [bacterium]